MFNLEDSEFSHILRLDWSMAIIFILSRVHIMLFLLPGREELETVHGISYHMKWCITFNK